MKHWEKATCPKDYNSEKNKNLAIIPSQNSPFLIESYSQNQCQYCLRFNKTQKEWSKTKKGFFPVTLKAPFLTLTQIIKTSNATGKIEM